MAQSPAKSAPIVVRGEIDAATAPALTADLGRALATGSGPVEVDLSAVTFIDSSGLRALIIARHEAEAVGNTLRIVATSDVVSRLLEVTGLTETLMG